MPKQIFSALRITALAIILSFGISYIYAWTDPTQRPPSGNVSAPVNVSSITQYKEGILGVGGLLRGYANAIFDGNVGIGTTNPAGMLQIGTLSSGVNGSINGASNPTRLIVNGASGSEAALTLGYYSAGYGLNLWVPANPSAPWPTYIDNINANSGFRFRNNTSATPVELMTIDAAGNVGIGKTSPTQKLDVAGNIKGTGVCIGTDCKTAWPSGGVTPPAGSEFLDTSATAQTKAGWLRAVGGNGGDLASRIGVGNNWWMSENTNGNYAIHRNGVGDKLTMDTNGNVGIGTPTPGAKLEVNGNTLIDGELSGSGTYGVTRIWADTLGSKQSGDPLELQYAVAGDVVVSGTDSNLKVEGTGNSTFAGNVGIGTTNPGARLGVSSGDASLALFGPNASWGGKLYVGASPNQGVAATAQVISTDGNLHLDPAPSKNMYLGYYQARDIYINPNGGNVGIGTTAPEANLHINAQQSNQNVGLVVNGAAQSLIRFKTNNVTKGYVGHISQGTGGIGFMDSTGSYSRLLVTDDGNVGIGKTNPGVKLDVAGQIKSTEGIDVGNAGGAYTYITMRDDESPNGVKYIHANSNVVGFLSGAGSWLSYWDNAGSQYNVGNINANDYYIRASGKWASQLGAGVTKQTTIYQAPAKATIWCWTDGGKQTCTNTCNGQLTTASTCLYAGDCPGYGCGGASAFANTNLGALVQ